MDSIFSHQKMYENQSEANFHLIDLLDFKAKLEELVLYFGWAKKNKRFITMDMQIVYLNYI